MYQHHRAAGVALVLCWGLGCEPPPAAQETSFTVPRQGRRHFLDLPWPSDLERRSDGTIVLRTYPNPTNSSTLDDYMLLAEKLEGFALNAAIYLGIGTPLEVESLPTPSGAWGEPHSSVQLVDVDPDSPRRGERWPLTWRSYLGDQFMPDHSLAVMPVLGFPLAPETTYAVVVTSEARTGAGGRLAASADLRALLDAVEPEDSALKVGHALFEPLRTLWRDEGRESEEIVQATVFTTRDPVSMMQRAADDLAARSDARVVSLAPGRDAETHALYRVYEGVVELDQFQQGAPPFEAYGSGGLVVDGQGVPVVQRREQMPFALTVPRQSPPAGGWPVALVAHGTGGWWRGFIGDRAGDEAVFLARAGWAALSISQPLHRDREGYRPGLEELNTFNFVNPVAGVTVWQQSALETVALARLLREGELWLDSGARVAVDGSRIGLFGHSQGGLSGALALGVDHIIGTAVLSGAGGGFAFSLLEKTSPSAPVAAIRLLLSLDDEAPLDVFHPVLTLLQLLAEPAEPLNMAPRLYREGPRRIPPSVLMTSGYIDTYTPVSNHAPLGLAMGLPVVGPVVRWPAPYDLVQAGPLAAPLAGNLARAGRTVTAGLVQFAALYPDDGHFVVFDNPRATATVQRFFSTAREGVAVIDPRP
ncbi:MAG: hypothetical protein ABIJ09_23130 [Pseudomonadota bacterium]